MSRIDPAIVESCVQTHSAHIYANNYARYTDFVQRHAGVDADEVNPDFFAAWRAELINNTVFSPATINGMLRSVRSILREAASLGLISKDVFRDFIFVRGVKERQLKHRKKANFRTRISPAQMRALCEAPDATSAVGARDRALLLTMASSGARVNEIVTLTCAHVLGDERGYGILVNGKTDVEWRRAPLSPEAWQAIAAWLQRRAAEYDVASEWVFTAFAGRGQRYAAHHISTTGAWKLVKKYAASCELADIKPHDFRRFMATQLVKRSPRQAQLALGHKSILTTYENYVLDEMEDGLTDDMF